MKIRPAPGDYAPYSEEYIKLIPDDDIVETLKTQLEQTVKLFSGRSEREGNFRYGPDKWTMKAVVGHVADAERIFAFRALRFARGDETPLPRFDQDDYVRSTKFGERKLADVVEEYADVRRASLALFRSFDEEAWLRRGLVNNDFVTVLALAYLIGGHELHHRTILYERYFPVLPRA